MNIAELEARLDELEKKFAQHIADGNVLLGAKMEVQNWLMKARSGASESREQIIDTSPATNATN